jgi:hypothetical protein
MHVGSLVQIWRRVNFQAFVVVDDDDYVFVIINHELSSCLIAVVEIKNFLLKIFSRFPSNLCPSISTILGRPGDSVVPGGSSHYFDSFAIILLTVTLI